MSNPDQRDTNQDGFGNLCDGDFNQDGIVGLGDYLVLSSQYGNRESDPGFDADVDLDGDGIIGGLEFARISGLFSQPVGPSGLACAGTIPCSAE